MSISTKLQHDQRLFLGIDLGTSGIRICVIEDDAKLRATQVIRLPAPHAKGNCFEQQPSIWWKALKELLKSIGERIPTRQVAAIAVDGTSGSLLVTDGDGNPLGPALMYRDARATEQAALIETLAPANSAAHGPSSGLAKLLWLRDQYSSRFDHALNQADWIMGRLSGQYGISDESNCLKLGYDPINRCWPEWMGKLGLQSSWLPRVYPIAQAVRRIDPSLADRFNFPLDTHLVTGTTDSIAALLATGAQAPGDAVTSLGSTLVLKVISSRPLFAPQYGVYSHRLGDLWLAGGASNTGGGVLQQFFNQDEIDSMTAQLCPNQPTALDYYPLPATGERFPIADPGLQPRLFPRPIDPVRFFQGILEGIAQIERQGYVKLHELGAPYPHNIRSVGGGTTNAQWSIIRQRLLGVELISAAHTEAAYGAALLARNGIICSSKSL